MRAPEPIDTLYARLDSCARTGVGADGWTAYAAVLDRLAANVREAEAWGWTSCAIERADRSEPFRAWGVPPWTTERHPVPDGATDQG